MCDISCVNLQSTGDGGCCSAVQSRAQSPTIHIVSSTQLHSLLYSMGIDFLIQYTYLNLMIDNMICDVCRQLEMSTALITQSWLNNILPRNLAWRL